MDDYDNAALWPDFRHHCIVNNVMPVPWYTHSDELWKCPTDADNVIGEIEGGGDREGFLNSVGLLTHSPNLAIITDWNGFRDSSGVIVDEWCKPFRDLKVTCISESYLPDGPTHSPDHDEFIAKDQAQFYKYMPACGCYLGKPQSTKPGEEFTLADYSQWINDPAWWVWSAETVL